MNPAAILTGRVALVAGATRGAGRAIAVELARAGAHVYATGRSSRTSGPSEIGRPETIEDTSDLITAAGGRGTAVAVDHEDPAAVTSLMGRIENEQGRLDILVNDIFGGDRYAEFDKPLWEHDLPGGLRMLRMGVETHLVTSAIAIPLMLRSGSGLVIEMTDGTHEFNQTYRHGVGFYYDLVKATVDRIVHSLDAELADHPVTALGVTPGWLRSENMLEQFGVTERQLARRTRSRLRHLRIPHLRRARRRRTGSRPRHRTPRRTDPHSPTAGRHLRRHRRRWVTPRLLGPDRRARHGRRRRRHHRAVPVMSAPAGDDSCRRQVDDSRIDAVNGARLASRRGLTRRRGPCPASPRHGPWCDTRSGAAGRPATTYGLAFPRRGRRADPRSGRLGAG